MRRNTPLLLVGAVAALAVACRDSVVAPARNATSLSAASSPVLSASEANHNRTLVGTLELSPNGGTYHLGDFDIVMPAGAVCDPERTKYGKRHWDDDCAPLKHSLTVSVVARKNHDGVSVDFQPDLRFRPGAGWVVIQTSAYRDFLTGDAIRGLSPSSSFFESFAILYAPSKGGARVNELRDSGDPSMVTHVDLRTGLVWRRIKHFSGYLVNMGFKCDPSVTADNSCPVDDGLGGTGGPTGSASISSFSFSNPFVLFSVVVTPNDSTSDQQ